MPSNQKTFTDVNAAEFEAFRNHARVKGWTAPNGTSGYLRGGGGLMADLNYDEKATELHFRVRNAGKGESYDSFFGAVGTILKSVDR